MQETVKQKMNQMKLFGMQQAYHNLIESNQQQNLTNDDFINLLIQAEWEEKENRINRKSNRNEISNIK